MGQIKLPNWAISDYRNHLLENTIKIEPAEGYIRIEDLMKREITAFEQFFVETIDALVKLDFQLA